MLPFTFGSRNSRMVKPNEKRFGIMHNLVKEVSDSSVKYFFPRQSETIFWCIFYQIFGKKGVLEFIMFELEVMFFNGKY